MTTLQTTMAEALRLTRAGKLGEATALIQAGLTGDTAAPPRPREAAPGDVIDVSPLKVTLSPLRRATAHRPRPAPAAAQPEPVGRVEERTYAGPTGSLGYRLYTPAGAAAGMPLVVMLHGCTQTPEDFARGTGMDRLADERGFLVAYPRQTQAANAQKCWNWFKPGDQRRDGGEPALIAGLTRELIVNDGADPSRVYVAGLSAGGAAAAIMAAAYSDLYAAVGIHSGLACGSARDLPSAMVAMRGGARAGKASPATGRFVPVITFHGDKDATVSETNSRQIVAAASAAAGGALTTRLESGRSDGGRSYTRETSADAAGQTLIEQWTVHGSGHAWSGGDAAGSYVDATGPDASHEMIRFFLERTL